MISGAQNNGQLLLIRPVNDQWPLFTYKGDDRIGVQVKMNGLFEVNMGLGWARRTYYVDDLRRAMTGTNISHSQYKRFSNGMGNFYMDSSFVYDMTSNNILLMGVGSHRYEYKSAFGPKIKVEPEIIYISEEFDTSKVITRLRSVRSIWRKAMAVAKDRGIRMEKIPQKEINLFVARFNWQPDTKALDNIEANMIKAGISEVYGSIRT